MKFSTLSPRSKFVIGLTLYGLAVPALYLLALLTDFRFAIGGLFFLGFITFVLALYAATRSNKTISVIVIAALLLAPVSVSRADDPPPNDPHTAAIVGCVVVIVGGVIIWGLWKICKMIPPINPPPPKNPPPPNGTNQMIGSVSGPGSGAPALLLPDRAIYQTADWQMSVIKFQSSTNLSDWREEYAVTNWFSGNQLVSLCASNGVPLQTNFVAVAFTNDTVLSDFSAVMPDKDASPFKAWRAVQLQ